MVKSPQSEVISSSQKVFSDAAEAVEFFTLPVNRQNYPRLAAVLDYWNSRRNGKFAANKKNFALLELGADTVPYCMMVDVVPEGPEFIYRYWGTKCAEITKQEMTGKNVKEVEPKVVSDENYKSYCLAYEVKSPLVFAKTHAKTFLLDSADLFLRLPLTENGKDSDFILTVFEQPDHLIKEVGKKFEAAVGTNSAPLKATL